MPYPQFIAPLTPCNLSVRRCPVPREEATKRILIIKFGGLGDILMATPLLSALRDACPEAHISWLADHGNLDAIDANPYIDEVISWEGGYWTDLLPRRWKKWFNLRRRFGFRWLSSALRFWQELRRRRYDILISFHPEQWPLLSCAVTAPLSIGVFETAERFRESKRDYSGFYKVVYKVEVEPEHRINKYLMPLNALGLSPTGVQMTMGFTSEDAKAAGDFLAENGVSEGERFAVLVPKTTWEAKCWPEERFSCLGDRLKHELGLNVVVIGSSQEVASVERVATSMQVAAVTAAGCLSFRQVAALVAQASLVVSSDGGPMHVASAVGTKYVALFGPTPATRLAPLSGRGIPLMHPVPCGPCDWTVCENSGDDHMRCMRLITVEEVLDAATRLLGSDAGVARAS